jgi:uncharacterized membrane protein YidH (DUF202 family)
MKKEQEISINKIQDFDPRIDLAIQRTIFSLVSTQLAWVRTILTIITAGLAIDRGFAALHESRLVSGEAWVKNGHFGGLILSVTGTLLMVIVTILYIVEKRKLYEIKGLKRKGFDAALSLSIFIVIIGLLAIYFMLQIA